MAATDSSDHKWLVLGTTTVAIVGVGLFYWWYTREPTALIYKSGQLTMIRLARTYKRNSKGIVAFHEPHRQLAVRLVRKQDVSHNVRRFRFALPSAQHVPGLEPCQHVTLSAPVEGRTVSRPYTPVSDDDLPGFVDFVIKIYGKTDKFPKGGLFSQFLDQLPIGAEINARGPVFRMIYKGNGDFSSGYLSNAKEKTEPRLVHYDRIGLIAGGSGITPIMQIINKTLKNPDDKTQLSLLFANQTEDDILLKAELDALAAEHAARFRVQHVLSRPAHHHTHAVGYITPDLIQRHLAAAGAGTAVAVCGPPAMRKDAVGPALASLGFPEPHIYNI